ncbi:uncharacterized protein LOC133319861 [Danaus plexippus]|uniref:uncharacterized protein LOC133319861 n=1 Tax=Danaus plexippus TaxID=13037 RepID=UPI002AB10140|nr:uncharacterized protein LOC133319861 [Danaus plexippus]
MSDKGYGDCTNRNVVKNPLLSTAVTGLSVEDLTHNAVLLPAVPSQELIARQDERNLFQNVTLGHSDHDITNFPSGDAAFASTQPRQLSNINQLEQQKQSQNANIKENYMTCKSKDSIKSDDDFDFNEYFVRLQGTRYVSAPINSNLKEDQNANLQVEENLEEINLNEPDKLVQEDIQNSLTADIAQNFSQLPSVLPQVASAVFSSFSNMLSLKNKDQISDDSKNCQHAQLQDMTVSAPGPGPSAPSAPPLTEPPVSSNTSNYRITTKKKVYAQIPGIISSDNNVHTFSMPSVGQTTNYFTPDMSIKDGKEGDVAEEEVVDRKEEMKAYDMFNENALQTEQFSHSMNSDQRQEGINMNVFHNMPIQQRETLNIKENMYNKSHTETATSDTEALGHTEEINIQENLQDTINNSFNKFIPISQEPSAIIPPPPMFSSLPRRDSQSSGRSVLPPSVARRIGAHQPVIKNQTSNIPLPDNIFVPNVSDIGPLGASKEPQTILTQYPQQDSIYNAPIVQTEGSGLCNPYIQTTGTFPSQDVVNSSFFTQPTSTMDVPLQQNNPIESKVGSEAIKLPNVFSPYSEATKPVNIVNQNVNLNQPEKTEQILAPLFFSPANISQTTYNSPPQEGQTGSIAQSTVTPFHSTSTVPEPPKAIPEPPKLTGNLNYRMIKKRPQYYSGPIEGFGSISNNIKPTIQPVDATPFSGSLFHNDPLSVPPLSVDYNPPVIQNPSYDINSSIHLAGQSAVDPYLPQVKTHEQTDFNTAFDLSRPTTERYEQPPPPPPPSEPKGFGIIGSLKSKLSSIDINKIQNTVTTFFDPAYNESKIDQNNPTESSFHSISGNYQNFPPHESAALEVFVPNIENEYQQSNPYNYQLQTHQLYNNQQYYPKQEYFNPPQGYSNDFYSNYPSNTNLSTTDAYIPAAPINNDSVQPTNAQPLMGTAASCSPEYVQSGGNPQEKEKQTAIDDTQLVETAKSALDEFGITGNVVHSEKVVSNFNPVKITEKCDVEGIAVTDSLESNYGFPDKVIQPPQKSCKDVKPVNFNTDDKTLTSNSDIIKELQSVADSTLKKVFDCQTPVVVESALENDNYITSAAPDAALDPLKSFFDYPHPICPLATSKKDFIEVADCNPLANDSLKCFFNSPAPTASHGLELKNEFINQNTQSVISTSHVIQGLSESADFKGLCTVLKAKSENLQPPTPSTVQNALNETPLFSLFDQPPLLPPVPSFDLSKISSSSLPTSNNESAAIQNIENKMDNISLYDAVDNMAKFERRSSFFDKTMPIENDEKPLDSQTTDLNIWTEDKGADLTTQLIENITAPIQLAYPVDFPTAKTL